MTNIFIAVLLAAVTPAPKYETTRALVIRCGGERFIGTKVQGRHGAGEFLDIIERERIRCEILKTKDPELSNYDCDKGACELVQAVAEQVHP